MEVKTESGGSFDAAGRGSTALGIVGTVLGGLATAGSGLLGMTNMSNNGNLGNCNNRYVCQEAFKYAQMYDNAVSDLERVRAERYTDQAVIAQGEKDGAYHEKMAKDLLDIGVGVARMSERVQADREKVELREQIMNLKIQSLEEKLTGALALEAERRACGDQNLFGYVNATFVPGKLVMPNSHVCPGWGAVTVTPSTAPETTPAA